MRIVREGRSKEGSFTSLSAWILGVLFWGLFLVPPLPAQADDDSFTCDSLESVTPREGTVWSWFSHPCPPSPGEESPALLPGVGVTLQGFWIPTTLYNPTGIPVSQTLPLLQNQVETGFGGGIEITGWLAQNFAIRFQTDVWTFPPQAGQYAVSMLPILLGLEVKVVGGNRVYLYLAADGGAALNGEKVSNIFSGSSVSPYAQVAVGLNFYFLQFEASYGILTNPLGSGSPQTSGSLGKPNPFFIVPLTVGVHL